MLTVLFALAFAMCILTFSTRIEGSFGFSADDDDLLDYENGEPTLIFTLHPEINLTFSSSNSQRLLIVHPMTSISCLKMLHAQLFAKG